MRYLWVFFGILSLLFSVYLIIYRAPLEDFTQEYTAYRLSRGQQETILFMYQPLSPTDILRISRRLGLGHQMLQQVVLFSNKQKYLKAALYLQRSLTIKILALPRFHRQAPHTFGYLQGLMTKSGAKLNILADGVQNVAGARVLVDKDKIIIIAK